MRVQLKLLILALLFLNGSLLKAELQKFVIQTDMVCDLMIDDQIKNKQYPIPEFRQSSGGYLINCQSAENTFLFTSSSSVLQVKVLWLNSEQSSEWIQLQPGQQISLADCIGNHKENRIWKFTSNTWETISGFFSESRSGLAEQSKKAMLKQMKEKPLCFDQEMYLDISELAALQYSWTKNETLKEIKLINVTGQVIWSEKGYSNSTWSIRNIPGKATRKIKKGNHYTLQLQLISGAIYKRSFYLYTDSERGTLKDFSQGIEK